ncbi:AMP-binding protein [Corynebacterium sp. USCH3]|uniref:AMP-binding protein n=1 Tax=Corynebacterium sp. USCH3 TaxID=3024840 RepID=UPI0030AD9623
MTGPTDTTTLEAALAEVRAVQDSNWPAEVPRTVSYPAGTDGIVEYLWHWADTRPDDEAIIFYGRTVSYSEYDELSDRFAGWLLAHGVQPGDRVGVHLPNCPQFNIAMLGILKAGAVHVPINPLFREHELRHELNDAGVTVLLTDVESADLVDAVRPDTAVRHVATTGLSDMLTDTPPVAPPFPVAPGTSADWGEIISSDRAPRRPSDPDALAALNYTGGTTGLPKGCEHTQGHMLYTAASGTVGTGRQVGEHPVRAIAFLPVFWIAGEDLGILLPLVNGGTSILFTRWDATAVLDAVERHRATDLTGMVDNDLEILDHPQFDRKKVSSLVSVLGISFATKLNPAIRARWREAAGQTLREASYGMTETHTLDTFTLGFQEDDADLHSDPVFCGMPLPGTDILIVDEAGQPVAPGESGEIILRSPSVLTCYHNNPEATAEAFLDEWLRTGDVGSIDAGGALHYLARNKEMIKTNGMSVFPAEVEAILRLHPDIATAAVVPRSHPEKGQVAAAFVTLTDDADIGHDTAGEEALHSWAALNMAGYKVPVVTIIDEMPMTATGKIRKGDLFETGENR